MQSFKTFITENNIRYVENIVRKYKIPDDLIIFMSEQKLVIALPDAESIGNAPDPHPSVAKLIKDLTSGRLKLDRLMSYSINNMYSRDNKIVMSFANERVTRVPKKLYHWTKAENVESILKNGLKPSSGDWQVGVGAGSSAGKVTYEAIFLIKTPGKLSKNPGFEDYKKPKYQIIEVTDTNKLTLYKDPHMYFEDPFSVVSYDPIPPEQLSLKK